MGIRIKGLDKLQRELKRQIDIFDSAFKQRLGKMARDLIYKRVKSGYGVDELSNRATRSRLKPLAQSYVEQRSGRAAYFTKNGKVLRVPASESFKPRKPKLGAFGSPGRSNLTLTGQMLEAIRYESNARGIRVFIQNSARDDGHTNAEIADLVQSGGSYTNANGNKVTIPPRPFFVLTQDELTVLVREIERELRKKTRRK